MSVPHPPRLDFEDLPLIEAAARITIAPVPLDISFNFLNELKSSLEPDFRELLEPETFEQPPGMKSVTIRTKILGAVFGGHARGLKLTINPHLVAVRWVKQPVDKAPPYPRFPELSGTLWKAYDRIRAIQPHARPYVVNLVYQNLLQPVAAERVLMDYFTEEVSAKAMNRGVPLELILSWREPTGMDVRFELRSVDAPQEGGRDRVYHLATAAGMFVGEGTASLPDILTQLHDRLQFFFRDILSARAKAEWKLQEVHDG